MHERGYVKITKDKKDARALRIKLNPKCTEYFKKREKREIEFLEKLFTGFDVELTQSIYKGFIRLEQNIKTMRYAFIRGRNN